MGSQRLASAMINYWPHGDEVPTGDPGGGPSPGEPGEGGDDGGGTVGDFPTHYSNPGVDGALVHCLSVPPPHWAVWREQRQNPVGRSAGPRPLKSCPHW